MLKDPTYHFKRIGLEARAAVAMLFSALTEAEVLMVCVETRTCMSFELRRLTADADFWPGGHGGGLRPFLLS
jgi:hypothetical protein